MNRPVSIPERLILIALLAIVAASPFAIPVPWVALTQWMSRASVDNVGFLPAPVANQTWFIIFSATTTAIAAALMVPAGALQRIGRNGVAVMALVWLTLSIVRGVLTPGFGSAYSILLLQSACLLLFISASSLPGNPQHLRLLQVLACIAVVPLAWLAVLQNAGYDPLPYSPTLPGTTEEVTGKHRIASTFGHPNYMGSYMAPIVVLATGLFFSGARAALRALGAVAAISALVALLVGGTRGPLLAMLAGFCVFAAFGSIQWQRRRVVMGALFTTLAAAVLLMFMFVVPGLIPKFEIADRLLASKEIASRVFYWITGLEMFMHSPILGIGTGQFDLQFWQTVARMPAVERGGPWYFVLDSIIRGVRPGQMHNDHLQVLTETGLLGTAAWVALWSSITYRAVADRRLGGLGGAYVGAFAAISIDAVFGFPFHLPCSAAFFWVALGLWAGAFNDKS